MTGEYAPDAIREAFEYADAQAPELGLKLGGILGTSATGHTWGYHRSRRWDIRYGRDGAADYSVQLADDKAGDPDAASALDLTPKDTASMIVMTRRLIRAVENRDPRLRGLREFFGTVNGTSVTGRDVRTGRPVTADTSHLWHLHCSGLRRFANDADAWRDIMDVIVGNPLEEGLDMAITKDELREIVTDATWHTDGAVHVGTDPENEDWAGGNAVGYLVRHVNTLGTQLAALQKSVDALAAKVTAAAK